MPSSLLQVVNSLFQTCYNNWEQAVRTCWQPVNRFVTTYLQTCNNLCVFTCVPVTHETLIFTLDLCPPQSKINCLNTLFLFPCQTDEQCSTKASMVCCPTNCPNYSNKMCVSRGEGRPAHNTRPVTSIILTYGNYWWRHKSSSLSFMGKFLYLCLFDHIRQNENVNNL
jgi:hypothetical protein